MTIIIINDTYDNFVIIYLAIRYGIVNNLCLSRELQKKANFRRFSIADCIEYEIPKFKTFHWDFFARLM